jgi:hypothetical protein
MNVQHITQKELTDCIAHFERFARTYFWTPPSSASSRRSEERRNSREWTFTVDGQPVTASVMISCSCRNYYAYREVTVGDEQKKMMVPYLRKCLAALAAQEASDNV